ncbi:MAG: SRPBCC family protein [Bacteroidia bacterium]|nr:SRPBCC family protein [Bacteroidia bacterium]
MKITKYVLIFVGFGLLGTLIAAFFAPKQHVVVHEMTIERPVADCWNACFNPDILPNWVDDLDTVEHVAGHYDRADYNAFLVFRSGENSTKAEYSVDSVTHQQAAKTNILLDDKLSLTTRFYLNELDSSKTNVKVVTTLIPSGFIFRLMLSGANGGLSEKRKAELEQMKKWLENQATRPTL